MRRVWLAILVVVTGAAACKKNKSAKPGAPGPGALELDGGAGALPRGPHVDAAIPPPPRPDASLVDAALFDGRMPPSLDGGTAAGFDGHPGWLIVGDSFDRHGMALARAHDLRALGVPASVVQTNLLSNLRPGLFVTVLGRFDDKAAAQARAAELKAQVPKLYVKQSGAIRGNAANDAGMDATLAALVRVHGTAKHQELESPLLHIVTPDGNFDTRPDADGGYELWAATPGWVSIEMDARGETDFPEACSKPGASHQWIGGSDKTEVDGRLAELELNVDRQDIPNPCD